MDIAAVLSFSQADIALMQTCSAIAGVASLIRAMVAETDLSRLPEFKRIPIAEEEPKLKQPADNVRERLYSLIVMFCAGAGVGFGVSLLFVGALQPQASSAGRVWLLSLILGFTTPKVLDHVQRRIDRTLQGLRSDKKDDET